MNRANPRLVLNGHFYPAIAGALARKPSTDPSCLRKLMGRFLDVHAGGKSELQDLLVGGGRCDRDHHARILCADQKLDGISTIKRIGRK